MNKESPWDVISKAMDEIKAEELPKQEWKIGVSDPDLVRALPDSIEQSLRVIKKIKTGLVDDEVREVLEKYKQYKFNK